MALEPEIFFFSNSRRIVSDHMKRMWGAAMPDIAKWMGKVLVPAMVHGGLDIEGIEQTSFYKFITSPEGLSQLGINASEPPKLLEAYKKTFRTEVTRSSVRLLFGDVAVLKSNTIHPATGTGKLSVESWLDWIVDKEAVTDAGFIPRESIPKTLQGNIRLSSPLGGLMLPRGRFGSTGLWRFPSVLAEFDKDWLSKNKAQIELLITFAAIRIYNKKLRE